VEPALSETGLVCVAYQNGSKTKIPICSEFVVSTAYGTCIGKDNATIATVEHLLAALFGMEICNGVISVYGDEIPILDGSAKPFCEAFQETGIVLQERDQNTCQLSTPIHIEHDRASLHCEPGEGLEIAYSIHFENLAIGTESMTVRLTPETFIHEIASARTFGFLSEIPLLYERGLARGGSLENALVYGPDGPINADGLRMQKECVRHKILDMVGDLAFLGCRLHAKVQADSCGHHLHHELVRKIHSLIGKQNHDQR
jgi:UDP-3-O-[3-hydroxymyristoyl] N-acetylglucosamine deacetylase